jgi:hypothetical protein
VTRSHCGMPGIQAHDGEEPSIILQLDRIQIGSVKYDI